MSEFKNSALRDALKQKMAHIVIMVPENEDHPDEEQDKKLIHQEMAKEKTRPSEEGR